MAIAITHAFVSGKADPPDASLIKPSNWNANHTLTMGTGKLVGRTTAASGAAEEISVGGALTFTAQTLSLPNNAITNAYLNDMATQTIKGRTTAGTGDPEDLTAAQVTAMLDTFSTSLKGLVPASGGGTTNYLRADGSWAAPPGAGLSNIANSRVFGNASGSAAIPYAITASEVMDMVGGTRGQILYRGASGWAALSPSTAGYVLRDGGSGADPSWVGGMTLLASGSGAGSAAVDLTLPSGYKSFKLILRNFVPATTTNYLSVRVSTNNGSSYPSSAGNYAYMLSNVNTSGTQTNFGATNTSMVLNASSMVNTTGWPAQVDATINPGNAATPGSMSGNIVFGDGSGSQGGYFSAYYGSVTRWTNIRLLWSAGGNFTTLDYDLYGVS